MQTIHCLDCRELYDAVTELKVPATASTNHLRWKLKSTPFATGPSDEKPPTFAAALNGQTFGTLTVPFTKFAGANFAQAGH